MTAYQEAAADAKRRANLYHRMRAPAMQAEEWARGLLAQWNKKPEDYGWSWRADLVKGQVILNVRPGFAPISDDLISYYDLAKEIPKDGQLCKFLENASLLKIEKTYETAGVYACVDLLARLPDAVIERLRLKGIIKESYAPGATYESVQCPVDLPDEVTTHGQETTETEVPF